MSKLRELMSLARPFLTMQLRVREFFLKRGMIKVLIYHHIPENQQALFAKQIEMLQQHYEFISPQEFENMVSNRHIPKGVRLLLTFDDGFQSNRKVCEEVLNPLGIKVLFFVLPDLITANSKQAEHIIKTGIFNNNSYEFHSELKPMNQEDIQYLIDSGHTIGSHTRTHQRLSKLDSQKLQDEIITSGDELEKMLAIKVRHFAYPFGSIQSINQEALQIASRRYDYIHSGIRSSFKCLESHNIILRDEISPSYSWRYVRFIIENGLSFRYWNIRKKLKKMAAG